MTRIAMAAIGSGCIVAVLAGVGPSGRCVVGAEPAAGQPAAGELPPELQAIRDSLGGSAVEHFPSLRPQTDDLSPWTSLSSAGAGVIRSVLVHCGLPCQAAAESATGSAPTALPPVIAPADPWLPLPYYAPWPKTAHAAIPTEWTPRGPKTVVVPPPTATSPYAPPIYGPLPHPVRAPAASPYPLTQAAATGVVPAMAEPPAAPSPESPLQALRSTAWRLDETAHRLEEMELYEQADSLREVAQKLRVDARSMATPTLVPAPTDGPSVNADPPHAPSAWQVPPLVDGIQPALGE